MKLTKRKGFNFFRSYFDVYNELDNDSDKLAFIDALLDRQFMGVKPEGLKGMAKFAYISQTNSIDSQVKGYEDKTKSRLDGSAYFKDGLPPTQWGENTPTQGGENTPTEQEKEKQQQSDKKFDDDDIIETTEELKQIEVVYSQFLKEIKKGNHLQWAEATYMRLKIKKGSLTKLLPEFKNQLIVDNIIHKDVNNLKNHLNNWLNKQDQINKLDKYKLKSSKSLSI